MDHPSPAAGIAPENAVRFGTDAYACIRALDAAMAPVHQRTDGPGPR